MGPFKCPDCGVWWAGFEHRCQPAGTGTKGPFVFPPDTTAPFDTTTTTVHCTCPPNRGDNYLGHCLIHDIQVTYT